MMPTETDQRTLAAQTRAVDAADERRGPGTLDLSVVIPAYREADNLAALLPELERVLSRLGMRYEIIVVTRTDDEETAAVATRSQAKAIVQKGAGYGRALASGFTTAAGEYVLTMDADLSHPAAFVEALWSSRDHADVIIASRYVAGGSADMSRYRYALSRVLNAFFARGLDMPIADLSSGFRLYRRRVLTGLTITATDFDVLQQVVVRAYAEGWRVAELPFEYKPRLHGSSHARVVRVGLACLKTFTQLWLLRNSIMAADYDDRAYDSRIPLQRYWQRSRLRYVTELIGGEGRVLDVGCGSSRIIGRLPAGSVAVDVLLRKLRYAKRFGKPLVRASGFALPFADASFPCVLCSQVIEHVPKTSPIIDELCRVLKPGGRLVLGTPDYANWQWVYIEKLYGLVPGSYADEHIAHYTCKELVRIMAERGFRFEMARYILRGELIMAFRKEPASAT
jgi:dolichol-phosphate mannosyltransferase